MDLKSKIRTVLKEHYGSFDSYLEHEYETKITETLINGDLNKKLEWLTYNQVILELKHNLKDILKVKELQYKLTENTNPLNECIEILEPIKHRTPELERLYNKIKNF
jgi:hypothetical protein